MLLRFVLFHENIAPRFERIGPVWAFLVGIFELRRCTVEVPCLASATPTSSNLTECWEQDLQPSHTTPVPRPVTAQIQHVALEPIAIHKRELAYGIEGRIRLPDWPVVSYVSAA